MNIGYRTLLGALVAIAFVGYGGAVHVLDPWAKATGAAVIMAGASALAWWSWHGGVWQRGTVATRVHILLAALLVIAAAAYAYSYSFEDPGLFSGLDYIQERVILGALLTLGFLLYGAFCWRARLPDKPPSRTRIGTAVLLSIATILLAATILKGLDLLDVGEIPRGEAPAIGFVPPEPAKPGRGFAVGLAVEVHRCNEPVEVTLVVGPTAEYVLDHGGRVPHGSFRLGIPGTDFEEGPKYRAVGYGALINPIEAQPLSRRNSRSWKHRPVDDLMTVISGTYPRGSKAVMVTFQAHNMVTFQAHNDEQHLDWLEYRSQGGCFVRLPALTGNFTAFAAEQAAGRAYESEEVFFANWNRIGVPQTSEREISAAYRPRAELVQANTVVTARGDVLADDSIPEPDTVVEGDPVWSCSADPRVGKAGREAKFELFLARKRWTPYSAGRLAKEIGSNCSAFVAVADREADTRRDVTILLVGMGIALGLGLFVEILMDWLRPEFPLRESKSADP